MTKLSVPFGPDYVELLGKAVYVFAYYESIIIYLIDVLDPGFLETCCRGKRPLPSSEVGKRFWNAIRSSRETAHDDLKALHDCATEFQKLIERRNALVHAHPITDTDGNQILHYQTSVSRSFPDMKWDKRSIKDFLVAADAAVGPAHFLYMKLK